LRFYIGLRTDAVNQLSDLVVTYADLENFFALA
jgi:hypothetical protein